MSKPRMAGDKLAGVNFEEGFSSEHLATLDQDKVKEALGNGGTWGRTDQARYDKLVGKKSGPAGIEHTFGRPEYLERKKGMKYGDGYNADHVAGLDQQLVELAWGGGSWGKEDQARYDRMYFGDKETPGDGGTNPPPDVTPTPGVDPVPPPVVRPTDPPNQIIDMDNDLYSNFTGSTQNVIQDNDVNITGNDNVVNQDNSVRQYGDTYRSGRSFLNAFMKSKGLR